MLLDRSSPAGGGVSGLAVPPTFPFIKRFLGYLRSVIDYYPDARLENSATGLLLKPSPTHIEQRPAKR